MAPKRWHHFVPQFYLRGFTDPATPAGQEPYVWVRYRDSGKVKRRAPVNVAAETGFYQIEPEYGIDPATAENELQAIETESATALRRYLSATPGTRSAIEPELGEFIAYLGARVPAMRRAADDHWRWYLGQVVAGRESLPDDPKLRIKLTHATTGDVRRETIAAALELMHSGEWTPSLDTAQYIEAMHMQVWYFRTEHFPRLHWALLTAPPDKHFITSDRPVAWSLPDGIIDSPAALRDPNIVLTVPLDAHHALLGFGTPRPADLQVRAEDVNLLTALHAERFVISPDSRFGGIAFRSPEIAKRAPIARTPARHLSSKVPPTTDAGSAITVHHCPAVLIARAPRAAGSAEAASGTSVPR